MPKINLSDMHNASQDKELFQITKDIWTREAATEIDTSDNYGCTHYYSTWGNYLVFACKDRDGYTHVYETKIQRSATFAPDGTQLK